MTESLLHGMALDTAPLIERVPLVVVYGDPKVGKCLGEGTPVLMFNGEVKPVETIKGGDLLMGPDSRARTVLSTVRGREKMYQVEPTRGEAWTCTYDHILTLVDQKTSELKDITVFDWERMTSREKKFHKLTVTGVDWDHSKPVPIDPYFLGVWFGDGTKSRGSNGHISGVRITKPDAEIYDCVKAMADSYGLQVSKTTNSSGCPTWNITGGPKSRTNPLLQDMREVLSADLTIPRIYKFAYRKDRAKFLAGFIDTDGCRSKYGVEIVQKRVDWADDLAFIAKSLGLRVTRTIKTVQGYGDYVRLYLSGDFSEIPIKIARKQPKPARRNYMQTGFKVLPLTEEDYYGFTLDGDGRFLLGDFTITHNSTSCAQTFSNYLYITSNDMVLRPYASWYMQNEAEAKDLGLRSPLVPYDAGGMARKDIPEYQADGITHWSNWDHMNKIMKWYSDLNSRGEFPLAGIVIDEFSTIATRVYEDMKRVSNDPRDPRFKTQKGQPNAFGPGMEIKEWVKWVCSMARNKQGVTGKPLVLVCHPEAPDQESDMKGGPRAGTRKARMSMCAEADVILRIFKEKVGGNKNPLGLGATDDEESSEPELEDGEVVGPDGMVRRIQTESDQHWEAGFRGFDVKPKVKLDLRGLLEGAGFIL